MKEKYFKNGDPALFNYFSPEEMKNMTPRERAMWTPFSEENLAPIPKEVIEFQNRGDGGHSMLACDRCIGLETRIAELETELAIWKDATPGEKFTIESVSEEDEKKIIREELRKRDIKFAPNTGLVKLRQKLTDHAND